MSLEAIRSELESATSTPEEALRGAVEHTAEHAPTVIELTNKVCEGVYLLPKQERLLFDGLYALAAAGETTVFRPPIRSTHRESEMLRHVECGEGTAPRCAPGRPARRAVHSTVVEHWHAFSDGSEEIVIDSAVRRRWSSPKHSSDQAIAQLRTLLPRAPYRPWYFCYV